MALVLDEVVAKDELMKQLRLLDLDHTTSDANLLEALRANGPPDEHYRRLCAQLVSEILFWAAFLAAQDINKARRRVGRPPSPTQPQTREQEQELPTDSAEAFVRALAPVLRQQGAHALARRCGLGEIDDFTSALQSFAQRADLLGFLLGELLACRLMGHKRAENQKNAPVVATAAEPADSDPAALQYGDCIGSAFAVLELEHMPEAGHEALRAIEARMAELLGALPPGYNRPLLDNLDAVLHDEGGDNDGDSRHARLEAINDRFRAEYAQRQDVIVDRFRQTLAALFRVRGVPAEIKAGLQANIDDELAKHRAAHPCAFSTWDIAVAREDLVRQQTQRINVTATATSTSSAAPKGKGGDLNRMKSLVVNMEVYRRGSGARPQAVSKKDEQQKQQQQQQLPKRSRRRRKWETDDADSLPTSANIEGDDDDDDNDDPHDEGEAEEELLREDQPLKTAKKDKKGDEEDEDEDGEGEEDDGELTREEREERRRVMSERREQGEKRKADELRKKKAQEPRELSKKDKQFLKQQLKKEKRQQRREKKLERTRRGNRDDEAAP